MVECGGNRMMGTELHPWRTPTPNRPARVLLYVGQPEGRRRRRSGSTGVRRRRYWPALLGAIIGWGLAGLEGGIAGTVEVPVPTADFVASGTITSSELGTGMFDLASNGEVVRQVLVLAEKRDEMVYRAASKVTLIDAHDMVEIQLGSDMARMLEPFDRAKRVADGPLEIVRDGAASHLGIPCIRYRAVGTADGHPLYASACITVDGIPLVTEILGTDLTVRTQITRLDRDASEPTHFLLSTSQAAVEPSGG